MPGPDGQEAGSRKLVLRDFRGYPVETSPVFDQSPLPREPRTRPDKRGRRVRIKTQKAMGDGHSAQI